MEKLIVKNFGPLKDVELDIRDCMVFIGPQAGGKSTLSKLVFFFKSISEITIDYFRGSSNESTFPPDEIDDLVLSLRKYFLKIFDSESLKVSHGAHIKYEFASGIDVFVSVERSVPVVRIMNFGQKFEELAGFAGEIILMKHSQYSSVAGNAARRLINHNFMQIRDMVYVCFGNVACQFIPDGRGVLSVLSGARFADFLYKNKKMLDGLSRSFSSEIELIRDGIKDVSIFSGDEDRLIKDVLKGTYQAESNIDRIYFDKDRSVGINGASSGQKESLWLMLSVVDKLEGIDSVFANMLFIEEPEAHLFPDSQYSLVELFALFLNTHQNRLFITTHSPYILAALNNFLQAHVVGQKNPEGVEKVFKRNRWIDPERVGAYFVENGGVRDIMDRELGMIRAEEIDSASKNINRDFDAISELDV